MISIIIGIIADLLIIGLMVLAFFLGKHRELPRQLIRFIAWILSFIISIILTPIIIPIINKITPIFQKIPNNNLKYAFIFVILFTIIRLIIMIYHKRIEKLYPDINHAVDAGAFSESALAKRKNTKIIAGLIAVLMVFLYLIMLQPLLPIFSKLYIDLSPTIMTPMHVLQAGHNASEDQEIASNLFKGPLTIIKLGYTHSFILKIAHILSPLVSLVK